MIVDEGRIAVHKVITMQDTVQHLKARLAKAQSGTPDETATLATFTECDFTGYGAIIDPAWDVPTINGSGQAEGKSALLTYTAGALGSPQTIIAMYLEIVLVTAGSKLLWFKEVSPTVTLALMGEVFSRYIDLFVDDIASLD